MADRLIKKFKAAVLLSLEGTVAPKTPLESRAEKGFAVTSKKKFLKELDKRLQMFAEAAPMALGVKGLEDTVPLPAKVHFNKGALKVWRGPRKAFDVGYNDLRRLDGMKQLVKMAKAADVSLTVQLFAHSANAPSRDLIDACEPTPLGSRPWTMKHDLGAFTDLYVTIDPTQGFDKSRFPKKLPKPDAPSA